MENNRRKSERINISLEVIMEFAAGKREVRVSDLSEGGCFVDSISVINNHENLSLKVRMPPDEWIELHGKVVSVFPGIGFGIKFNPLTEEDRSNLEQLVLVCGGKLSQQSVVEHETQNDGEAEQKEGLENTESVSYGEFEQFVEDLTENAEDDSNVNKN